MAKALIVWGGWEGHEPEKTSVIVRDMLVAEGFDVAVENGAQGFDKHDLSQFDLIVPMITQEVIEQDTLAKLVAAIESGVGLGGFHGGMGDSFRSAVDYQFMVGGQWVAHPGNIIDYTVNIAKPDDPIVKGIGDFEYHSEQYYMHVDPSNEVLAETTFSGEHAYWIEGAKIPVVWKRKYGKGRVFYSALGHVASEFDVPQMREILRRGLLWAKR